MPKKNSWQPAENFIRSGVRGNYSIALTVATYHFNALTAHKDNLVINELLNDFTPIYEDVVNSSSDKWGIIGDRMGNTMSQKNLFSQLQQTELPEWQRLIGNIYPRRSAEFKALFAFGLKVFNYGPIENKLSALKALMDSCLDDAALAAIGALIETFYLEITGARKNQTGDKSLIETGISTQQTAIEAMCVAHFGNHGFITYMFPDQPKMIKSFTDWQTLQANVHSAIYKGTINPEKRKTAARHKLNADSKIKITATVDVLIWVVNKAKNPNHPVGELILKGVETIVGFPSIGNPDDRVVQVQSLSQDVKGKYSIEFL